MEEGVKSHCIDVGGGADADIVNVRTQKRCHSRKKRKPVAAAMNLARKSMCSSFDPSVKVEKAAS